MLRGSFAVVLIVIIVISLAAPCFSAAVPAIEAIDLFGTLYSAYLVAHGLDAVVSNNGVISDGTYPLPEASWRELWQQNFDYYAPLVDDAITSAADWVEGYLQDLRAEAAFGSGSSPSPSPDPEDNGVIGFQFTAQISEFFDKLTNLILKDKYDLNYVNDAGFSHSSGSFDEPLSSLSSLLLVPTTTSSINDIKANGLPIAYSTNYIPNSTTFYISGTNGSSVYVGAYQDGVNYRFVFASDTSGSTVYYTTSDRSSGNPSYINVTYYDSTSGLYYAQYTVYSGNWSSIIPVSDSLSSVLLGIKNPSSELLELKPQDKYSSLPIPVPDTESSDYVPQPQTIIVNVPWPSDAEDPDFTDLTDPAVASVVDPVIEASTSNTLAPVIPSSPPADPSPVMPPFLPSQPPTFNFNLGGIWYYVVRWVNSVRSGAALIFSVFNNLPPAMFYPIFGSAVAVIVIGVWRRFVS